MSHAAPHAIIERRKPGWAGMLIVLLAILVSIAAWSIRTRTPLLHNLEGQVIDVHHRLRGPLVPGTDPALAIIMVDDASIAELGRLPLDRRHLARSIDLLSAAGARLIVIDMLFLEPARIDRSEDVAFAEAIARSGRVVLPFALSGHPGRGKVLMNPVLDNAYLRYQADELARERIPFKPQQILQPLPEFARHALALGNVSAMPGHDGTLRYDQPLLWFDNEWLPTMVIRVAALALGVPWQDVEARVGEAIDLGARKVPLDIVSRQWVNYYGPPGTFDTYPMADLVGGRLDPSVFADRIVLIGGSGLGASDRYPSPFDPALPGVERMATLIDNVLTGRWLARPGWAAPIELASIIILPWVVLMLVWTLRPLVAVFAVCLLALLVFGAAQWLFAAHALFVSVMFPNWAIGLAAGLGIAHRARSDESLRRLAEAELRASEMRYALAASGANDGLWDWDVARGRVFYSERWCELMGVAADDMGDTIKDWLDLLDQLERDRFDRELAIHLEGQTVRFYHLFRCLRAGDERWLLARGMAVRDGGRVLRVAGSITDLTEQKRLEQRIAHDALHDRLTGLPNRDLFVERLGQSIVRAPERIHGVIMVDIDRFIELENRFGRLGCNAVLLAVTQRLKTLAGSDVLIGFLGGDTFVVGHADEPAERVGGVRSLLEEPVMFDGAPIHITVTLTTAHTGQGLADPGELLAAATLAMTGAKQHARGGVTPYDPAIEALENSQRWLDDNIRKALAEGGQFELYYQPFVRLRDRRLVGFEALIRWTHPERGFIMPGDFIPYAEQSGLINEIGRWTLREGARQLVAWSREGFDGEIAVNLSGRQFLESDLNAEAQAVLDILGDEVLPSRFKFEVTESMSMDDPSRAADLLRELAAKGFKISIDDFGTGYSSLSYLHQFPFNTLKIDRSFVIRLDSGREAQAIVRTITQLAVTLERQALAEGIEDESQAQILESVGVEIGQGWLFDKPLPVAKATEWIKGTRRASGA